ncbi:hypothetical protein A3K42_00420 [candidate division WWE3 bacterium RBG_13_37_7]|uniref:Membrane insertase YidC/Oxa/ALB C-terminal domain-containing protein n=1 Tax=candidate division WWE3 bacterium RBG_13_37_7 TaxID=1802609 RepID=A0A1F4U1Z6_UNCKA|nr:MAG: hypothetical protein A3K42_00420 [candidate division WWE3 bacterium RBG_13_37_7]
MITTITHINTQLYFDFLKLGDTILKTRFFYLDLTKPDPFYITAVLSGILQFIASKMMMPAIEKAEKAAEKTPGKMDDLAYNMQQQSLYMMPVMSVIIGVTLPAGIMLYIVTTTLFSIVQNYCINGWGGVKPWIDKIKLWKRKN